MSGPHLLRTKPLDTEIACIHAGFKNVPQSTFNSYAVFVNALSVFCPTFSCIFADLFQI
jgi:hypothetical protein